MGSAVMGDADGLDVGDADGLDVKLRILFTTRESEFLALWPFPKNISFK